MRSFELKPFSPLEIDLRVSGSLLASGGKIQIRFVVEDPDQKVSWPAQAKIPRRQDKLWEQTCFELFVAFKNTKSYLEFNFSPSGDWNAFRFDDYRLGKREEAAAQASVKFENTSLGARVQWPEDPGHFGISCILFLKENTPTYWALRHPASKPDFHDDRSFCLSL